MPQRSEEDRKTDRSWYRTPYNYAAHWRAREWGPLERRFNRHPLRDLFLVRAYSHDTGLRWLKAKGYVGAGITAVEEIHPDDVHWILDEAQVSTFSMEWIEHLRESWVGRDAKAIEAARQEHRKRLAAWAKRISKKAA